MAHKAYLWIYRPNPGSSLISNQEDGEIWRPGTPELLNVVIGAEFWDIFVQGADGESTGDRVSQLNSGGRMPSHATLVDYNHDQVMDILVTFEEGEQWVSFGPFDPGHPIHPPQF